MSTSECLGLIYNAHETRAILRFAMSAYVIAAGRHIKPVLKKLINTLVTHNNIKKTMSFCENNLPHIFVGFD